MLTTEKLAIHGGSPVRTRPWLDNITTGEEEKKAVCAVMDSGYLSLFEGSHTPTPPFSFWGGPWVQKLEQAWCEYYQVNYAVSMNSATSGIYAAIGALGLGYGDEVIVSPYTMTCCATAPLIYGAIPIFADVQLETGCLDPASIEAHITERTKAILLVHQYGIPADMDAIMALAKKYDLKVIEDCAHVHGGKYKGKPVGTIGDIGIFSLNINKSIQAGEGGICTTNDEELRYRLALIRNHGEAIVEPAGYENITNIIGYNYRLSEVAAAISLEQLKKLNEINRARISYAHYLNQELSRYDCFVPLSGYPCCSQLSCDEPDGKGCQSVYYLYPLRYLPEVTGVKRHDFVKALNAEGMSFYEGYIRPLYLQPIYQRKLAFKNGYPFKAPENRDIPTNYYLGACPNAEKLYFEQMLMNEHIRLPHTMEDMEDIVKAMDKVMRSLV